MTGPDCAVDAQLNYILEKFGVQWQELGKPVMRLQREGRSFDVQLNEILIQSLIRAGRKIGANAPHRTVHKGFAEFFNCHAKLKHNYIDEPKEIIPFDTYPVHHHSQKNTMKCESSLKVSSKQMGPAPRKK